MDGTWTRRRKWRKVNRKAEERRAIQLLGSEEEVRIQLEKEYVDETCEKNLHITSQFLENPNCKLFMTTLSKLITQHMYDMARLARPADELEAEKEFNAAKIAAAEMAIKAEEERKTVVLLQQKLAMASGQVTLPPIAPPPSSSSMLSSLLPWTNKRSAKMNKLASERSGEPDENSPEALIAAEIERLALEAEREKDRIPWADERFNRTHMAICKV